MKNKVVTLNKDKAIGTVVLEDRGSKNTFSNQFVRDLKAVFEAIGNDPDLKVVVIHGFDNYFCCGGTKQELIDLCNGVGKDKGQGRVQFDDLNFHDILLKCNIPVIAAMQGHALGGGLAFGCYADVIVLGKECIYSAVFMKYGFTPGMGSTYIIPERFGDHLGNEMLLTARNYYGEELKERGAPVNIVQKQAVIQTAMDIANELAKKPLLSLKVLKKHLNRKIVRDLPEAIELELEMHRQTFVQNGGKERIEALFGN